MKPQFLTDETLVSHRRNFGIKAQKPTFFAVSVSAMPQ